MRLGLSLIAVAFLVGCTDTGAHLTFSAPMGPDNAKTFRVVLAAHDQIPAVRNQRVAPGDRSSVTVSYFLQRTVAGVDSDEIGELDGFTVRIAPDGLVPDTQFIPFVLLYDGGGAITGIASYRAGEEGIPSPILVMRDEIDKYKLTVEKVTQIDDATLELQPGEVRVVSCAHDDQTTFTSGLVWHTLGGDEYRLLLPNDGTLDATGRQLDMDCDDHEVTAETSYRDCDDTRDNYHRDAPDVCDGNDTNCDGAQTIATACQLPGVDCNNTFATQGVSLCNDETTQETACHATATCGCSLGSNNCQFCMVPFEQSLMSPATTGLVHPCQPAIGTLGTRGLCDDTDKCDIEVVAVRGGWKIEITAPEANAFGPRAYDVGATLAIKAKRTEGTGYEQTGTANMPVADIDLAFITATQTIYVALQLRLEETKSQACSSAPMLTCY